MNCFWSSSSRDSSNVLFCNSFWSMVSCAFMSKSSPVVFLSSFLSKEEGVVGFVSPADGDVDGV